jgi:predicted transcriptional regulator
MFKTYISYHPLKKYLTFLIQQGLISYRREEKRFSITQQGFHALDTYTKMDELLVRKTLHKRPEYFASFP